MARQVCKRDSCHREPEIRLPRGVLQEQEIVDVLRALVPLRRRARWRKAEEAKLGVGAVHKDLRAMHIFAFGSVTLCSAVLRLSVTELVGVHTCAFLWGTLSQWSSAA